MESSISTCPDPRNLTCRPEDNLTLRKQIELECRMQMIIMAVIAIALAVSTIFLVITLIIIACVIFRMRKNIKILIPMAKLLAGQATGLETQEIKRVLLTLLDIQADLHQPPPLPSRPTRLALTQGESKAAVEQSTGATVHIKDKIEVLSTPQDIKRYEKYLEKQKRKVAEKH